MSGYDTLKKRLTFMAGGFPPTQENINTRNKFLSFKAAMGNSEQFEEVIFHGTRWPSLINPDKLNEDVDQKIMSIEHEAWVKGGETVYWPRTNSYWLVLYDKIEEKAYKRVIMRKSSYEVDVDGRKYRVAVKGPSTTSMQWATSHQITYNNLNYDLMFYVKKDERSDAFFKRFQILKFEGHNWRVAAVDRYTLEGVLQVFLEEHFDNEIADAALQESEQNQVVTKIDKTKPYITGPASVKAYDTNITYTVHNATGGRFIINSRKVNVLESTDTECIIDIISGRAGELEIVYELDEETGEFIVLPVIVESL